MSWMGSLSIRNDAITNGYLLSGHQFSCESSVIDHNLTFSRDVSYGLSILSKFTLLYFQQETANLHHEYLANSLTD